MSTKRILEFIGLLATLATICALFVAIIQLIQAVNVQTENQRGQSQLLSGFATSVAGQATAETNQRAQNASLVTQVALQEKQLSVQQTIAAVQGKEPQSGGTATVLAQTLSPLSQTSVAIETQRRQVNATQTTLAQPTTTPQAPTGTRAPPPRPIPSDTPRPSFPTMYLTEDMIPSQGSTFTVQVGAGTIHILTSGPICALRTCLPGGEDRGSVVVLLPSDTPYTLSGLIPKENWHGAYYAVPDQWTILANDRVASMKNPGSCTGGKGCAVVDVLAISGGSIVSQYSR